jgi:hypothetical protein
MSVSYECCVLSGRGLCDELITRPEESYRVWCVSKKCVIVKRRKMRRPRPPRGCRAIGKKNIISQGNQLHVSAKLSSHNQANYENKKEKFTAACV